MSTTKVNRNDPCPCGSGRKFKKCCMGKVAEAAPAGRAGGPAVAELLSEAQEHHRAGRLGPAIQGYRRVIELDPPRVPALFQFGRLMGQVGQPAEGVELLTRAVAIDGSQALYHGHLAAQLIEVGRSEAALRAAERALELDPANVWIHCAAAGCLERMNRVDEAAATIRRGLRHAPDDPQANITLAGLLRRQKKLDEARQRLERVLEQDQLDPQLHQRAQFHLGTVLDRQGEYPAAFEAYRQMGIQTEKNPVAKACKPEAWTRTIKDYREHLTPGLLAKWPAGSFADDRPAPVFLVGFPRSGTTMTEQVLAAHPRVVTSDEEQYFKAVTRELSKGAGAVENIGEALDALDADGIVDLRRVYWEQVEATIGGPVGDRVFIDKIPLNIVQLGLINVLFPEAKIIVALRDPRDVCLSCFFQDFRINAAMLHFTNLPRTVEFYRQVMDLWLHLREMITLKTLEIRYEDTVRDLEPQARRILDLLELDWDPAVLAFHERAAERLISTPSFEAVTAPVHTRAIGRWKNYREQFGPLLEKLAPFVESFGYEAS